LQTNANLFNNNNVNMKKTSISKNWCK
jgi:hypothetical protein